MFGHQDPSHQQLSRFQPSSVQFDVTNHMESMCLCCFSLGVAGLMNKKLVLEDDEVFLHTKSNCTDTVDVRTYAQLGAVDSENECVFFWGIKTEISMLDNRRLAMIS